ncbi:MAG: nucleotide exchange factor GrpE, partial [Phascolarctobacterium sp.]|nr:nucleotide exchange factor GrpE [Phascolarctobacterium sp.]
MKDTTTEETSANEQEVREESAAEETVAEEQAEAKEEAVVDEKDEKITELNNRLMRLQADFDNFRRRTQGEKEQLSSFVTAGVVGKFLKVLDNFERAEASAEKTADLESLLTGMKQIRRQFEEVFKELG